MQNGASQCTAFALQADQTGSAEGGSKEAKVWHSPEHFERRFCERGD